MKDLESKSMLSEEVKRNVRESLVYAVFTSLKQPYLRRVIIQDFYASLNRKAMLWNFEAEAEVEAALKQLEALENPATCGGCKFYSGGPYGFCERPDVPKNISHVVADVSPSCRFYEPKP
jgi:hypothetical protein